MLRVIFAHILIGGVLSGSAGLAAERPQLSLPLACQIGQTCFIQNYMDLDPGDHVLDPFCGRSGYDGDRGTDFRVLSLAEMTAGVEVLAPADGVVKAVREGEDDVMRLDGDFQPVKGRECGNGLVIDHGDGWETQLCHLKKGSLRVSVAEELRRGQGVGLLGVSGRTQFPHVEMSLRHNGVPIDPFTGLSAEGQCRTSLSTGLWDETTQAALPYVRGQVIEMVFTDRILQSADMERRAAAWPHFAPTSQVLVLAVRSIHLLASDVQQIVIEGPEGVVIDQKFDPLPRNQAVYVANAGRKLQKDRWPAGRYTGMFRVWRDGKIEIEKSLTLDLP